MTEQIIRTVVDCSTGIAQQIPLTEAEILAREQAKIELDAFLAQQETERLALETLKTSARAKLVAGETLTEEEAAVLVI
jgi:hypothetical protein